MISGTNKACADLHVLTISAPLNNIPMKKFRFLSFLVASFTAVIAAKAVDTSNIGKQPEAGLVQGSDIPANGDIPAMLAFYGTTSGGGTSGNGTFFQVTDSGQVTTLVNFTGMTGAARGSAPVANLIRGTDGNYYGTTYAGGTNNLGTAFKVTAAGILTTLADFTGTGVGNARGANPSSGLLEDPATPKTFYGTTTRGGTNDAGTIFRIAGGVINNAVDFDTSGASDPEASLIKARDGLFYGTTAQGAGISGTVYSFDGTTITVLYAFTGLDGAAPYAELIQGLGTDTALYGTTSAGGTLGFGTIFSVTPAGTFDPIYSFNPANAPIKDGSAPFAGLVAGTDNRTVSFYGTTFTGGVDNYGTVFQILVNPGPTLNTLASFVTGTLHNQPNGSYPEGRLLRATDGFYYGTTSAGGVGNSGTVFRLDANNITSSRASIPQHQAFLQY